LKAGTASAMKATSGLVVDAPLLPPSASVGLVVENGRRKHLLLASKLGASMGGVPSRCSPSASFVVLLGKVVAQEHPDSIAETALAGQTRREGDGLQ
jgi:hypothetical protein